MAEVQASNLYRPFKNKRITFERVEKFISPVYFADVNLFSKLYPRHEPPEFLGHFAAGENRFMKYDDVTKKEFVAVNVGDSFGPSWTTHWFKLKFVIPTAWSGTVVVLRWNSNSEALIWYNGRPQQGLTGGDGQVRTDLVLAKNVTGGARFEVYIEMAANGMFGVGKDGMINPPDPDRKFSLSMAEIAVRDDNIQKIICDLKLLLSIAKELPDDNQRGWQALYAANDVVNCFQPETQDSCSRASVILDNFFKQKNGDSQHVVHAVGHCHIDTAWLWPYDETKRKCARSWSSVIGLMKEHPDFKFACSQAQQFEWVKQYYPDIYSDLKYFVKKGQFIPVGGTWVEMDGNLPNGESFVRQFLYGQRFFEKEFGKKCEVFWLPDTFGYSAQLPQIMKQCGMKYFVTQKLSWNLINKFPHSTFLWEGIDGSRILTHFPPAETYESNANVDDVLKSSTNNKDKGRVNDSLLLFGYGDGGGGPTEEMVNNLKRLKNVDGVPRVKLSDPMEFFKRISPVTDKLNVWADELYLELHQGTFTTQSQLKSENIRMELRLRFAEFVSVIAWASSGREKDCYPTDKLLDCWKLLLLSQFHDVLPGTSIKEVCDEANSNYNDVVIGCHDLIVTADKTDAISEDDIGKMDDVIFNPFSWKRFSLCKKVITKKEKKEVGLNCYQFMNDSSYCSFLVELPPMSFCFAKPKTVMNGASIIDTADGVTLQNNILSAHFDKCGRIVSMKLQGHPKRDVCFSSLPCNQFVLFDDMPLYWDAWDVMPYYQETRRTLNEVCDFSIEEKGPILASFRVNIKINNNTYITQMISLTAESPFIEFKCWLKNWNENRKFLRLEFPVDVHSQYASYGIQFGHVRRPTHGNTSWDWAKYEVCAHKWFDLSEYDFGVALLLGNKFGCSVAGNTMSISLTRSPKAPDQSADMGNHHFYYAMMPHTGTFQSAGVIQQAHNFGCDHNFLTNPFRGLAFPAVIKSQSFFEVSSSAVIVEAIKKAEDADDVIILRLYEAYGGKTTTTLSSTFNVYRVARCNMLEELLPGMEIRWDKGKGCEISFNPFEIVTLALYIK